MEQPAAGVPDTCRVPAWLAWTLLIAAGFGLRLCVIARSEVAARDSIGFVRYALRFEREPWTEVIRSAEQPPGYAAVVLLVSQPVRAWFGRTDCDAMVLSAQLASALMAALSIVPMVLLGRDLADRRTGWLAALIFLSLPAWLRLTSDGLSEGTYLFWLATTIWLGVRALRKPSVERLFLCGFASGCAYLTRPEGLELAGVALVVLFGMQFVPRWRQPWLRVGPQALALVAGAMMLVNPYVAVTGRLTNKNTGKILIGDPNVDRTGLTPGTVAIPPTGRTPLAVWWHEPTQAGQSRQLWAAWALGSETLQSFHYFGAVLACAGLAVWRTRSSSRPGGWLLGLLVVAHAVLLWRMAIAIGYLSERHTLLFVFAGCFPAAAAILWLGRWHRALPVLAATALIATGVPAIAKPMHGNRSGHKAAGVWLSQHATARDEIYDPFGWAEFYAGRLTLVKPPARPERIFVVWETADNQHSRLPGIPIAKKLTTLGEIVYRWPESKPPDEAQIVVYELSDATPRKVRNP